MRSHWVLLCLSLLAQIGAAEPDSAEFQRQADRCRRILQDSLISFYLPHCLDRENGGYMENLRDDRFVLSGEKFLTLQARHLWFFSTLAREGFERPAALEAARHGYQFITEKMRDPRHGGYFSKVTDAGEPKDARKHAYLNSFTIYALVAYANAAGDKQALRHARDLFRTIEKHARDREFGGYVEFFEQDWKPVTDRGAQGYVGGIGQKTYNTHLHLLESFAELYRAWPDPELRNRLAELVTINTSTVHYPTENNNVDAFEREWSIVREPRNLRASYGHDVECVWLVLDAADAIGMPRPLLQGWGTALSENCLKYGFDEKHGGFYDSGPLGQPADQRKKTWWVQTEALLGMLDMYRLTREEKYWRAFAATLDFCENYHVAEEGGWWATRAEDGSPAADKTRTGPWQGAYHAARALIQSAKWLEELSAQGRP